MSRAPLVVLCTMTGLAASSAAVSKDVMLMNRIGPSNMALYIANADGSNERRLLPDSKGLDYDPSFSPDGQWIVFTSERDLEGSGQADLYRVHPDGTGLERLTTDTSMEDAGALSPDGTQLVYVSTKGGARTTNIWVMDLKSRRARNLTGDGKSEPPLTMNSNFRPAWSPDGKWIAFTSDRGEQWAGAESGAGAGHTQPTSVYIVRADGTGVRRLTSTTPTDSIGAPKWSADGKKVVVYQIPVRETFAARMAGFPNAPFATTAQIMEVDVASGAMTAVTSGPGLKTNPQYLASGKIGYLMKGAAKDGETAGIAYSDGTRGTRGVVRSPSWSPDGRTVVYYKQDLTNRAQYTQLYSWDKGREYRYTDVFPTLCAKTNKLAITDLDFPFGNPTASVSVLNPDGTNRQKVFQRQDGAALVPTWSPDCKQIAFGFGVFFGGRGFAPASLRMVDADGSDSREVLSGKFNVGFPAWSPDGTTITFRTWGDEKSKEARGLRALKLADNSVSVLTTEWDNFPFYSPSGDRIVFTRRMPDADFEVFTMKPDGSDVTRLTMTRGADAHATWSNDGREIWFESSRTGFKDEAALYDTSPQPYAQVFLMKRDGTNVRQLTDSKWEDSMGVYLAQNAAPAGGLPGAAAPATIIHSELQQLTPNVYAFVQREEKGQSNLSVSNFGIVVGPRSLLAIDAGGGPQHARNFIAAAKPLGKPFDRVVITHEHPDHIVGLTQFPAGIEIVAQEETRAQMVKMGTPATPAYWATNPAWGKPGDLNKVILPTVTFSERMTVHYGETPVEFYWPGRAHTSGDALVLLPKEKILFMGDIAFFGVTPLNGSGFVDAWIKVCDRIIADERVETIVPGHGPVGGKAELKEMRDYLALLLREGRRKFDAGVTPGRAAAEIDLGRYATWTDPERIATNMARLYSEFRGTIGADMDREAARQAVGEFNQLKGRK